MVRQARILMIAAMVIASSALAACTAQNGGEDPGRDDIVPAGVSAPVLTLAGSTIDGANIEASAPFVAHDVYPGIDLSASTIGGDPSYTFVVTPAGDPRDIELTFPTASQVRIAAHGGLLVGASDATYRQPKPLVYQIVGAHMVQIGARYVRRPEGAIGIRIDPYAEGLALVIDPGLHRVEAR